MSAHNLMTLFKRTSLNVYDADIFNCSRQSPSAFLTATNCGSDPTLRELWGAATGTSLQRWCGAAMPCID
jgi:hypothetical protein